MAPRDFKKFRGAFPIPGSLSAHALQFKKEFDNIASKVSSYFLTLITYELLPVLE